MDTPESPPRQKGTGRKGQTLFGTREGTTREGRHGKGQTLFVALFVARKDQEAGI